MSQNTGKSFLASLLVLALLSGLLSLRSQPPASAAPLVGITERVSVSSRGEQGDDWNRVSSISGDGRFVAFDPLSDW